MKQFIRSFQHSKPMRSGQSFAIFFFLDEVVFSDVVSEQLRTLTLEWNQTYLG